MGITRCEGFWSLYAFNDSLFAVLFFCSLNILKVAIKKLLWHLLGMVICITQPRRVAAVTVATRVAEERAAVLGHEVRKPDISQIKVLFTRTDT